MRFQQSPLKLTTTLNVAVTSIWTQEVDRRLDDIETSMEKFKRSLFAIKSMIHFLGSQDFKPDDEQYKSMKAQTISALHAFARFLSTPVADDLVSEVDDVFFELRRHGEEAGLLLPVLIRAMSDYLDAFENAHDELPRYLEKKEKWIQKLRRNLEKSEQVRMHGTA